MQANKPFRLFRFEHHALRCGPMSGVDDSLPVWYELFKKHPIPIDDTPLVAWFRVTGQLDKDFIVPEHFYFGLTDKEALYTLVQDKEALKTLKDAGYKIYTYDVETEKNTENIEMNYKVFSHINQVAFNRSKSKVVEVEELCFSDFSRVQLA